MNFVTLEFATFFLFVLVAGWLLRERDGEYRAFLLVCNLFFYALAGMAFVPLLLAVAVLNWGAVHLMSRFSGQPRKRKGVIAPPGSTPASCAMRCPRWRSCSP